MTLDQFLQNYYCEVDIENQGNINLTITTKTRRRLDHIIVDRVKTDYDIQEMSQKIGDSQTTISLMPLDWKQVVDHTKRAHIDYLARRAPIDDYYSIASLTNPDTSKFYQ